MDFRHLIVTCLFSKLRLPFDNQKVKENYAIFFNIVRILLIRVFGGLSERAGRIVSVVTISLVMNVNLSDMPVNCG